MKKILTLLMIIISTMLVSCGWNGYNFEFDTFSYMDGEEVYTQGEGTKESPYIIDTKGKLIYLSNQINRELDLDLYYELVSDIDLENMEWTPIGIFEAHYQLKNVFKGHFNGNGHTISNFKISKRTNAPGTDYYGLFGFNAGTITNLNVTNVNIDISYEFEGATLFTYVGALCGINQNIISNCYAEGSVSVVYSGYSKEAVLPEPRICVGKLIAVQNRETKLENCSANVVVYVDTSNSDALLDTPSRYLYACDIQSHPSLRYLYDL